MCVKKKYPHDISDGPLICAILGPALAGMFGLRVDRHSINRSFCSCWKVPVAQTPVWSAAVSTWHRGSLLHGALKACSSDQSSN